MYGLNHAQIVWRSSWARSSNIIMLIYIVFAMVLIFVDSVEYFTQPNDRILFVGHSTTLQGETLPFGFVNIFSERAQENVANVSVSVGSSVHASNEVINNFIRDEDWLIFHSPTKIVLTLGTEMFTSYYNLIHNQQLSHARSFKAMRLEIESMVAKLVGRQQFAIVLAPILFNSESVRYIREDQKLSAALIEESVGMFRQIARDYGIMYIDIPTIAVKCLEKINPHDLPHSVLTYDGRTLNAAGHEFIATSLADALLLQTSESDDRKSQVSKGACGRSGTLIKAMEDEVRLQREELVQLKETMKSFEIETAGVSAVHV